MTTHVSAWFGRAQPPASGVGPIRAPGGRTDVRGWRFPSEPRSHDRGYSVVITEECPRNDRETTQTRTPLRQPPAGHDGAVPEGRVFHQPDIAELLPADRRSRDHLHAVARPGNRAVRGRRRARLRPDRPRLDRREWRRRDRARRAGPQQGQPPAGPLGAGRTDRLAHPIGEGPGREADRHRSR